MKILWLTNYPLPIIAKEIGIPAINNESWLISLSELLASNKEIEKLIICFPQKILKVGVKGNVAGIDYYGYFQRGAKEKFDPELKNQLLEIIKEVKPDVIHLMGSEFPHCYAMIQAAEMAECLEKTAISIQGLVSVYAQHYMAYMPTEIINKRTIRDIIKKDSLKKQEKEYIYRGIYERKAFQKAEFALGRTEWDYACAKQMNSNVKYLHAGETLRSPFYENKWHVDKCKRHSIFISQATYPIKGFHILLQAANILKNEFPDLVINVASKVPYGEAINKKGYRNSTYVDYICTLIKKYKLQQSIRFLGALNAEEMCKQYLDANVFVSCSSIENSPNSVGEAMLLGTPVVSSNVGGVCSMINHKEEGLLYTPDEPYMLAHYVAKIFNDDKLAIRFSEKSKETARKNHDPQKNLQELIEAYKVIAGI